MTAHGAVDDLGHPEVHGHRAQRVGVVGGQAEPVDQQPQGLIGSHRHGLVQVVAEPVELPDLVGLEHGRGDGAALGHIEADLGIDTRRPGFLAGLSLGGVQFSENATLLVETIRGLLTGRVAASEAIAGPIGIAQLLGEGFQRGPSIFLRVVALFSLSLAIANLIPFPALDGSRAAFALYEWARRKPIPPEREGLIHTVGFIILMAIMLLVTDATSCIEPSEKG